MTDSAIGANQCEHGQLARVCEVCELKARLAECEQQRNDVGRIAAEQGILVSELRAEVARLTDKANRAIQDRDRQYEADGLRVLELQTANDGLRAEVSRLTEQLANEKARGIHSCWAECPRPLCVATRENDRLKAELAALREACLSAIDTLTNGEINVKGRAVAVLRDALGR